MRGRHLRARCIAKHQRQTIGHHDGAAHTSRLRAAGISHGTLVRVGIYSQHIAAMHLLQEDGLCALQRGCKNAAIFDHRSRRIAHMIA
jgi:hypothetical protein